MVGDFCFVYYLGLFDLIGFVDLCLVGTSVRVQICWVGCLWFAVASGLIVDVFGLLVCCFCLLCVVCLLWVGF